MNQNPKSRKIDPFLLIACLLMPLPVLALSTDQEQPINIEADTADLDDNTGTSIYRGNVIVTQGSIRLTGDVVTVFSPQHTLEKVKAEGNPATFKQRPDAKDQDMRARSLQMEYFVDTEKLILLKKANLWQEGDEISGNRIDYDIKADLGRATKGENERVRVILQPKPETGGAASAQPAAPAASPSATQTSPEVTQSETEEGSPISSSAEAGSSVAPEAEVSTSASEGAPGSDATAPESAASPAP